MTTTRLPVAAPARVLALGAYLKNRACLLDGRALFESPLHGDLGTAEARLALRASAEALLRLAGGRVDAVAHDLHPDFDSTRLAVEIAERLGVAAVAVQHHHAHLGAVLAERGGEGPAVGWALDGVGLGSDGSAWGGELLQVDGAHVHRLAHLTPLALPGGDIAAREPWRMAAAALHAMGRADEIVPRLAPAVGERLAAGVRSMLDRRLNCPSTTSAGRWFDAIAGLLAIGVRRQAEAEAAVALEAAARRALASNEGAARAAAPAETSAAPTPPPVVDLTGLAAECLSLADAGRRDAAAACFHLGLADRLAQAAIAAAASIGGAPVLLGGGCLFNRILRQRLLDRLEAAGARAFVARDPGDAGLALGQAWVAAHAVAAGAAVIPEEAPECA